MKYFCPRDFRRGEMEEYMNATKIRLPNGEIVNLSGGGGMESN